MPEIPTLVEMLKAGMHFGHRISRGYPKMRPYIFGARNGVHIINLETTTVKLREALEYVKGVAAKGGTILFVGTKRQAQEIIGRYATSCGMPFVNHRWLGGTLTNFSIIHALVNRYLELQRDRESGELAKKYTKKEQLLFSRKIEDLSERVGGIATLPRLPDAIFICDIKHDTTALAEAIARHIPIVAICDSNVNPDPVKYPIPANDDAVRSLELVIKLISEAVQEGKATKAASDRLAEIKKEAASTPAPQS
jgi:small subunit ribosomal protein S2